MKIRPTHYQSGQSFRNGRMRILSDKRRSSYLYYPGAIRPVIIPKYREVPVFVIKNNMRVIDMSREKYFELLEKV